MCERERTIIKEGCSLEKRYCGHSTDVRDSYGGSLITDDVVIVVNVVGVDVVMIIIAARL